MPASPDLVPISLRLDKKLLAQIDEYCQQTGQGRSSFLRSAAVAVMEGSVPQSNTSDGPMVDQEARDALKTLLGRVQELEAQVAEMRVPQSTRDKFSNFSQMFDQ